ncbi:carbohydrate ABC transporter permease [Antarctobacter heliothermus]|jgi:inositol-phosphate transport system permease protein|uniref:Inositol-phosphate transport system permease protein n=1 Tax=Antarctobacter heliothermus TaxID=74033 RepID=A0A239KBY6_9RHOB|nr:sugar ABC transporter permease [Antarctobacter heliothermus]SNT14634.1 inositol-phosphate transport system permease protein [Antarctobacter heliothermus]
MTPSNTRQATNALLFLGPACLFLVCLLLIPIIVDLVVAFTDMSQTVRVGEFTTDQFGKLVKANPEALLGFELRGSFYRALSLSAVYVVCTLAIFNVTFALILALTTTALPDWLGGLYRAIWLMPRMAPSVVYGLLWLWVVDPTDRGLLNQILLAFGLDPINMKLDAPVTLIVFANGFIGASLGMLILTSSIRSIPQHLFYAARADGAGSLSITRHIVLPALRWPLSYITVFQSLSLLVSFEYIFLIMGPARSTMTMSMLAYTKTLAPGIGSGQYAYGAAITLILIGIGMVSALLLYRLTNMKRLLTRPRIEVQ